MKKMVKVLCLLMLVSLITGCENKDKVGKLNTQKIMTEITDVLQPIEDNQNTNTIEDENVARDSTLENTEGNTGNSSNSNDSGQTKDNNRTSNETTSNSTNNDTTKAPVQTKKQVTITIECKTILNNMNKLNPGYVKFIPSDGMVLKTTTVEITDGTTVLDVLQQVCSNSRIDIKNQGGYVTGIGNIDASCCGEASGWMYSINGAYVNKGANKREVIDGESIKWMFTCSNGKDLGFR